VSRSWASREANAPGTRILIAELLDPHREQLNELFRLTLDLIKDAFQARKIFVVRGVVVDGGPDHYARLEAAKLFIRLLVFTQATQYVRVPPATGRADKRGGAARNRGEAMGGVFRGRGTQRAFQ
jgi:hypothetical protein